MKRLVNQSGRTTIIVEEPILGKNSPNNDIFDVGSEEGADSEDNMLSMIGDAVQKHVDRLSPKDRLVWEHFIHLNDGNLFFKTPNTKFNDPDQFNLKTEDLDNFMELYKVPEAMREYVQEAIDAERERRERQTEDAYDNNEGMVSFNEWEEFPQMMNHVEIPSTPKDLMIYAGNSKQVFYDEFPDGHPDSRVINQFLSLINRDIDEVNERSMNFVKNYLETTEMRKYTRKILSKVCDKLPGVIKHEELVKEALILLDRNWGAKYNAIAHQRTLNDPVVKLMTVKYDEWKVLQKKGINPTQQVKEFGNLLFKNFRARMSSYHWHLYKRLKAKFEVQVFIKGVDVNSASVQELRTLTNDDRKARNLWFARPFSSPVEVFLKGHIERKLLTSSDTADKIVDIVIKVSEECGKTKNMDSMVALANKLVQKQKTLKLDEESWSAIWNVYRSQKKSLVIEFKKESERERKEQELRVGSERHQNNQVQG